MKRAQIACPGIETPPPREIHHVLLREVERSRRTGKVPVGGADGIHEAGEIITQHGV